MPHRFLSQNKIFREILTKFYKHDKFYFVLGMKVFVFRDE